MRTNTQPPAVYVDKIRSSFREPLLLVRNVRRRGRDVAISPFPERRSLTARAMPPACREFVEPFPELFPKVTGGPQTSRYVKCCTEIATAVTPLHELDTRWAKMRPERISTRDRELVQLPQFEGVRVVVLGT